VDILGTLLAQAVPNNGAIFWIDKVARTSLSYILIFAVVLTVVRLAAYPYLRNTPTHMQHGWYSFVRIVNEMSDALIYAAIVVFMLVRPFGIQTFHIPTGSMLQTLYERDYIVANKMIYRYTDPKVGDIVVFHPPKAAFREGDQETDYIKRLVGAPGDVIEWKEMQLYRNGEPVDEPYLFFSDGTSDGRFSPYVPLPKDQWDTIKSMQYSFKLVEVEGETIPLVYSGDQANLPMFQTMPFYQRPEANEWVDLPPAKIPDGYYLFMGDHRNQSSDGRFWGLVPRENIIGRSEFVIFPFSRIKKTR
jgi:signal peptidase I